MSSNERSQQYFDEAREQLDEIERNLLLLEQAENIDLELVNEIFRGIHTIKGGADFLGLTQIKELSHAAEDVLDLVRKQKMTLTREGNSTLLVVTDSLKEMLDNPEQSQTIDISHLLSDITSMSENPGTENPGAASPGKRSRVETGVDTTAALAYADDITETITPPDNLELGLPEQPNLFLLPLEQAQSYRDVGFSLYILKVELMNGSEEELENILKDLATIGYLLDSRMSDVEAGRLYILYRSVLTRTTTVRYLGLDPRHLHELKNVGDVNKANSHEEVAQVTYEREITESRHEDLHEQVNQVVAGESKKQIVRQELDEPVPGNELQPVPQYDKKIQSNQSIRVNVEILDELMNLVGELVLTRNQLKQNVESGDQSGTSITAQRLDIVTSELQESIMSTRMQPLGTILSKFHRIIRDMSSHLGKSVNLVLEGEDVELDKSIIENISDPLTHLVRNAIDHGIEKPATRRDRNKAAKATLSIKARQEAGHVVIEISDDGCGIDTERVKSRALEMGIIDKLRADEISEKEILKLIFTPGFSTAKVVSDISGRGVGLDVVLTNISKLGGTIDVDTEKGVGTTFKVSLPLTLAIVPSLLVSSAGDTFAIPQINLIELVRIPPGQKDRRIEYLGDSAVVRLRDKLLPVVWLDKVLGLDVSRSTADSSTNIAVVSAGEYYYGIVVDHFTDSEEIVVKPLGKHLRDCHAYASATILGDGSAALILDINGIAEKVSMASQQEMEEKLEADKKESELLEKVMESVGDEKNLLIVENGENEYFGIELAYVNRIERIKESSIEQMAHKHVIKYRGGVLRIFKLEEAIETSVKPNAEGFAYLVVFYMMGTEVAVMVSNIVDIVDTDMKVDNSTFRGAGIVGSTIIMDRITLVVDLFELVKVIDPSIVSEQAGDQVKSTPAKQTLKPEKKSGNNKVLVVEDSVFFQDKLCVLLEEMGLDVDVADDGKIGWEKLNANPDQYDLVLMDVEMPNMTGLELCRLMRSEAQLKDMPVIMLTSLAKDSDMQAGKEAGATEYLIKMDQEMVRQYVNRYLESERVKANDNNRFMPGAGDHVRH